MISKDKHQKHPKLSRPIHGRYHQCEWAIYGTTCERIAAFYQLIQEQLGTEYSLTYVDADHNSSIDGQFQQAGIKQIHTSSGGETNEYDDVFNCRNANAVFVNGNHFPATRQIVFIDSKKKDSLQRRLEQLTHIDMLILLDDDVEVYDFLQPKLSADSMTVRVSAVDTIVEYLSKEIQKTLPPIKALILSGGKSTRMGEDKSQLRYHSGKTQEEVLIDLCNNLEIETFISKASTFNESQVNGVPVIKDRMIDMGPFGAILSAFMQNANTAWLVIACDLPFLDKAAIERLLHARNYSKLATALKDKTKDFPEPLIAIYEPLAYPRLLEFMSLGRACPRKMLINSDIEIVEIENAAALTNANTPADYQDAKDRLGKS